MGARIRSIPENNGNGSSVGNEQSGHLNFSGDVEDGSFRFDLFANHCQLGEFRVTRCILFLIDGKIRLQSRGLNDVIPSHLISSWPLPIRL